MATGLYGLAEYLMKIEFHFKWFSLIVTYSLVNIFGGREYYEIVKLTVLYSRDIERWIAIF